jgi:4-hydroxy-tetrahydrodipicolinate synthase
MVRSRNPDDFSRNGNGQDGVGDRPTGRPSLVVALPTPCAPPGVLDPTALGRWSQQVEQRGVDGVFVLSSTGEMVLIDDDNRRRLVSEARTHLRDDTTLLVGVGGYGPQQAIRLATAAAADGGDVAVLMAPFFQLLSQRELRASVEQIADASPIPIGLYHHLRMPTAFAVETVAALASHPNIVLFKDTSTDFARMRQLVEATSHTHLSLLQGSERLFLKSLTAGAHGCISALASIAPEWHRDILDAVRVGDLVAAEAAQAKIDALMALFRLPEVGQSLAHFVHTLKTAARIRGWLDHTHPVLQGFEATPEFDAAIAEIVSRTGLDRSASSVLQPATRSA